MRRSGCSPCDGIALAGARIIFVHPKKAYSMDAAICALAAIVEVAPPALVHRGTVVFDTALELTHRLAEDSATLLAPLLQLRSARCGCSLPQHVSKMEDDAAAGFNIGLPNSRDPVVGCIDGCPAHSTCRSLLRSNELVTEPAFLCIGLAVPFARCLHLAARCMGACSGSVLWLGNGNAHTADGRTRGA